MVEPTCASSDAEKMKSDWSPLKLKPQFSAAEQQGRTNESADTQQHEMRRRMREQKRWGRDARGEGEENEGSTCGSGGEGAG